MTTKGKICFLAMKRQKNNVIYKKNNDQLILTAAYNTTCT